MEGYYGIGEVFVKVTNLEQAAGFYRDLLGFEVVERNNRQLYIYLESGHLVLKEAGSPGHDAGGPMHFAFVTSTERINQLAEQFAALSYRTRGPLNFDDPRGKCRACLLYTSPSPRDRTRSRMPSSA